MAMHPDLGCAWPWFVARTHGNWFVARWFAVALWSSFCLNAAHVAVVDASSASSDAGAVGRVRTLASVAHATTKRVILSSTGVSTPS